MAPLLAVELQWRVTELSDTFERLLTGKIRSEYPVWLFAIFPFNKFFLIGEVMEEKGKKDKEKKLVIRRRLMKMAVYSIPVIATILATEEVLFAQVKNRSTKPGGVKNKVTGLS